MSNKLAFVILWVFLVLLLAVNVSALQDSIENVLGAQNAQGEKPDVTQALEKEYRSWQEIVRIHPDNRDGFFQLALLSYQLGRVEESKKYLENVRQLDPNFPGIAQLEAVLSEQ